MKNIIRLPFLLLVILALAVLTGSAAGQRADSSFNLAFFEAGSYPAHASIRNFYRDYLRELLPEGYTANFVPHGFKSAAWNRDTSKVMARTLAGDKTIDLVLTFGPWVVEDLLEAGFDRPIVACFRVDPVLEGLTDAAGRPIADNLTVRLRPGKMVADLGYLAKAVKLNRLGFLNFPSEGGATPVLDKLRAMGEPQGVEIISSSGFDRNRTFAFFKAYKSLDKDIDALYLPTLWGLDSDRMKQFYLMTDRDRIPVFSAENDYHVRRGAFASGSAESYRVAALYHAWKTVEILMGKTPADLPPVYGDHKGLTASELSVRTLKLELPDNFDLDVVIMPGPEPELSDWLTLAEAIDRAWYQNPGYQAGYERLAAAEQAARRAWVAYAPEVSISGSALHYDDNAVNNDDRYLSDRLRVSLQVYQEILSPGTSPEAESVSEDKAGTAFDMQQAKLDLELAVTVAYLDYLKARQFYHLEMAHRKQIAEAWQLAQLRVDFEMMSSTDAIRWESEYLQATREVVEATKYVEVARILFNTLLGRPGQMLVALDNRSFSQDRFLYEASLLRPYSPGRPEAEKLAEFVATKAALFSPRTQSAKAGVEQNRAAEGSSLSRFVPRIGFQGTLDFTREWADRVDFEEESPSWSAGLTMDLPLFGGAQAGHRRRLGLEFSSREFQRDQITLEVAAETRLRLLGVTALARDLPLDYRTAQRAEEYLPMVFDEFATAQRTTLELLEAIAFFRQAGQRAATSQTDYFAAVARLLRSMGYSARENGRSPGEELVSLIQDLVSAGN